MAGQLTRALIDGTCATDAEAERVRRELADCPAATLGGARVPTPERLARRAGEMVVRRGQHLDGGGIDAATLVHDELQPDVALDSGFGEQPRVAEWVIDGRLRGAIDLAPEVCRAAVARPRCDGVRAAWRRGLAERCDGEVGGTRAGDRHNDNECHATRAHDRMTSYVGERNRCCVRNADSPTTGGRSPSGVLETGTRADQWAPLAARRKCVMHPREMFRHVPALLVRLCEPDDR